MMMIAIIIIIIMITIIMNIMIILEYFKNQASLVTDFLYSDHTNSINSFPRNNFSINNIIVLLQTNLFYVQIWSDFSTACCRYFLKVFLDCLKSLKPVIVSHSDAKTNKQLANLLQLFRGMARKAYSFFRRSVAWHFRERLRRKTAKCQSRVLGGFINCFQVI